MSYIAIDTETHLIEPGNLTPKLVCVSYRGEDGSGVLNREEGLAFFRKIIESRTLMIFHNGCFDLAVFANEDPSLVPLIFKAIENFRVRDTLIREMLYHIRKGTFTTNRGKLSLNHLSVKYMDQQLDKGDDSWRYKYKELEDTPIKEWPSAAYEYARKDAEATYDVFFNQEESPDEWLQVRAMWALHLISVHGIITDGEAVAQLEKQLETTVEGLKDRLLEGGVVRLDKKGKMVKDTKVIRSMVEKYLGNEAERTNPSSRHPQGQIKIDSKALKKTEDESLLNLVEYSETEKLLTTYIPLLKQGTEVPINARFNVLVETGRTSCSKPNLQNMPRKPGVRECYIPREGHAFIACDYDTLELRALAQVCYEWFGDSDMRKALIEGKDLHLDLAAFLLDVPYSQALEGKKVGDSRIKEARQFSKIGNFGFAGGLGVDAFIKYAAGMGFETTRREAKVLRDAWFSRWGEMRPYFDKASSISSDMGSKRVVMPFSGRVRGGVRFTQAANTPFQGTAADGAKMAGFQLQKECWADEGSPLYGCRPLVFVHDEYIVEVPIAYVDRAAKRIESIMVGEMSIVIPDVPITCTAHAMSRWYKNAEPVFDDQGKLTVWSEG